MKSAPEAIERAPAAGRLRLWFCLWGGGGAWFFHLLAAWALAEFGCLSGLAEPGLGGISQVAWLVLAVSVLCLGVAAFATWWSGRSGGDDTELARFVARYGLVANPLFMFVILAQTLPVFFFLKNCGSSIG